MSRVSLYMLTEEIQSRRAGLWGLMANWWMRLTPRDSSLWALKWQGCQRGEREKQQGNVLSCASPSIPIQSKRLSRTLFLLSDLGGGAGEQGQVDRFHVSSGVGVMGGKKRQLRCCHIVGWASTWHQQGHPDSRQQAPSWGASSLHCRIAISIRHKAERSLLNCLFPAASYLL